MLSPRRLVALVGLAGLAAAVGLSPAFAARTVQVDLMENSDGDMMIGTSTESVEAGKVTFAVTNELSDIEHEFIIARLNVAPDKVPYDDDKGTIEEPALQDLTELGDLAPGASDTMTLDLEAGKYLLFCNLPGHYKEGMYHVLTVVP